MSVLDLQQAWKPELYLMDEELFESRFGFYPNAMQNEVLDIVNQVESPEMMIIEAPMGTGKTEAALAAAEIMASRNGCGGLYYGLPTKGTANGIFPRIVSWGNKTSDGMRNSIRLAHSDARNNREYQALISNACDESGVTVNEWLSGRHRALLSNFGVGTVDQLLLAGVLKKFIMLLHLGISGKVIIIDEVHAYDTYMTTYLDAVLSWAGAYHVPVILLSATLPVSKKKELIRAYTRSEDLPSMGSYPSITWSHGDKVYTRDVKYSGKMQTVYVRHIGITKCIDMIRKQKNVCTGVIFNSVSRAQNMYLELKRQMPDRNIILIHSRFLPSGRNKKEKDVLSYVGKNSTYKDRKGTIIIGTQVLEQSLDIDFDVIYTEKCPVDLLLQRIGREFRHERPDRPRKRQYCYIFEEEKSDEIARLLYSDYLIEQTDRTIGDITIKIPADVRRLTESVYDLDSTEDSKLKEEFVAELRSMRSSAKDFLIPDPKYAEFCGLINQDAGERQGVRYGNLGLEVLLWKRFENGQIGTLDGSVMVSGYPSYEEINKLANQKINLQPYMVNFDALEAEKKEMPGWVQNGFFKHRYIVLLSPQNTYKVNNTVYSYDKTYGYRKEEDNG